jgi:hypothetical protein
MSRVLALLDFSIVVLGIAGLPGYASQLLNWPPVSAFILLTHLAVAVSAVMWWWQIPGRFWITYLLFPLRIVIADLSFTWLAKLVLYAFPSTGLLHRVVWGIAIILEVTRLAVTIQLHGRREVSPADAVVHHPSSCRSEDPYRPPSSVWSSLLFVIVVLARGSA